VPELARAATDMMKFQDTPNPNSLKFVPGCPVLGVGGGTLDLPTARAAMVIRNNLSPSRRPRRNHSCLRYLLWPKQFFASTTFQASRLLQSLDSRVIRFHTAASGVFLGADFIVSCSSTLSPSVTRFLLQQHDHSYHLPAILCRL
jgi:hypothetical protein